MIFSVQFLNSVDLLTYMVSDTKPITGDINVKTQPLVGLTSDWSHRMAITLRRT